MIEKFFEFLIIILATWAILDKFFYSPKAQIKGLWEEIYKFSPLIKDLNSDAFPPLMDYPFRERRNKIGKLINSLLDNYFDPEEDAEYIEDNKYTTDEYVEPEEFINRIKKIGKK